MVKIVKNVHGLGGVCPPYLSTLFLYFWFLLEEGGEGESPPALPQATPLYSMGGYKPTMKGYLMVKPIILTGGYDTLGYTLNPILQNTVFSTLNADEALEKMKKENRTIIKISGFKLQKYRIRGRFVYQSDIAVVMMLENADPSVQVTLSSYGIKKFGYGECINRVAGWLCVNGLQPYQVAGMKIGRIDFYIDAHVNKIDYQPDNVVSRSKQRWIGFDDGVNQNTLRIGNRSTGIFGRFYDKRIEVEKTKKLWQIEYLEKFDGYSPDSTICRFEFQIPRVWLRNHQYNSLEDLKIHGGCIAKYLVNKFCRLIESRAVGSKHRLRAKNLPIWDRVQEWVDNVYAGDALFVVGLSKSRDNVARIYQAQYRRYLSDVHLVASEQVLAPSLTPAEILGADCPSLKEADFLSLVQKKSDSFLTGVVEGDYLVGDYE